VIGKFSFVLDHQHLGAGRCIKPDRPRARDVIILVISFAHIAHIAHVNRFTPELVLSRPGPLAPLPTKTSVLELSRYSVMKIDRRFGAGVDVDRGDPS
jgi:hypothetical protein